MASVPVKLTELDSDSLKKFLDSFDHVFSDCDGVLWKHGPIPGSGEFVELMKKFGKTVHFVSNNSIRTKREYEDLFNAAGIENGFENLTIPSSAIAEFLKSRNFKKTVYCAACPETIRILKEAGFTVKEGPETAPDFSFLNQFCEDDPEVGAVLLDCDTNLNLPKIYQAVTYLKREDVLFLGGASDSHWVLSSGQLVLGTGFFTDLVSQEAKRDPILLGKPGKILGELAMRRAGVTDPRRVLFIGDMIKQDVGLGKATGFQTLLVLSHHTAEDALAQEELRPDYYAECLGSILPGLKKIL